MSDEYNCLVAQSGGPTVAINSSLAGVIKKALDSSQIHTVYGAVNGIQGVLNEHFLNLTEIFSCNPSKLSLLKNTPSMYLGSCRYRLKSYNEDPSDYAAVFKTFSQYRIKYFLYIGGNDSMDTVAKLSTYATQHNYDISIIGIPKTIDNDLMCTDHTPGFGSAAKYIASSVLEIAHDTYIYNTESISIVEIMGRNAGWLTASSVLARNEYSEAPHLIYLPERAFSPERFIEDIRKQLKLRKHVVIAVSEGIHDEDGNYISARSGQKDQFGHIMLSGTGKYLENLVSEKIGCKVRSIELNVLQRCAAHMASRTDIEEAFALGEKGVEYALNGHTEEMVLLRRISNLPYQVEYSSSHILDIANKEKKIPEDWISKDGTDVAEEMVQYLFPLIQGELDTLYSSGIPAYLPVNHLMQQRKVGIHEEK